MHVAEELQTITTYNGWCNRETWVMNLWLTNEECLYNELQRLLKLFAPDRQAKVLEGWVREELEKQTPQASLWSDLLTTAIGRVNWYEIAENNR